MPNLLAGERISFSRLFIEGGGEIGVGGGEMPSFQEFLDSRYPGVGALADRELIMNRALS